MKKTKLGSKVQKKTKELDENDVAIAKKQQLTQAKKRRNKISEKSSKNGKKEVKLQGEKVQKISNKKVIKNSGNFNTKKGNFSNQKFTKKQKFYLIISGGIIGFLNGFFGGGGGMICVPILQKVLSLDAKKSHATAILVIFPLSLISAFIYVFNGLISSLPLLTVGLGVVAGGITGSFALKFLPPKAVRIIFAIVMFVGGIKLIL